MTPDKKTESLTRDTLFKLLSEDEVASVTLAETAPRLSTGDEYLDLDQLERGVLRAVGATAPAGRVLPRRSVREATWIAILSRLPGSPVPTTYTRA